MRQREVKRRPDAFLGFETDGAADGLHALSDDRQAQPYPVVRQLAIAAGMRPDELIEHRFLRLVWNPDAVVAHDDGGAPAIVGVLPRQDLDQAERPGLVRVLDG